MTTERFNYQSSSVEQIASHLQTVTRQALSLVKRYYKDNPVVLCKIEQAAKIAKLEAKRKRLQAALESLSSAE
jgi:hypothetical protein